MVVIGLKSSSLVLISVNTQIEELERYAFALDMHPSLAELIAVFQSLTHLFQYLACLLALSPLSKTSSHSGTPLGSSAKAQLCTHSYEASRSCIRIMMMIRPIAENRHPARQLHVPLILFDSMRQLLETERVRAVLPLQRQELDFGEWFHWGMGRWELVACDRWLRAGNSGVRDGDWRELWLKRGDSL
ncbi:hypothetical protein SERLADRAFT_473338 [Serpula lacrymans var. lacrymans S7.9]|uniref:Uncharacterized protein n=1 Tax=Serpula lacrymans var. lacrymans (strain S7.9) TaxID=578457 RepID=F8P2T7_SERL9|nr:uncharacterized protein SERLADRAFT_473338 [Serpula lacrymans var. lacrymans S7.9]EGO22472.1 hypothetical protein SERLADRAFT_473338 [Serpula lacrymans var. lacrymans S7.9]